MKMDAGFNSGKADDVLISLARQKKRKILLYGIGLALAAIVAVFISAASGRADIGALDAAYIVYGKVTGNEAIFMSLSASKATIVFDVRLPRILCAMAVGAGLAVAGTIFQALLMNPLADSYTMGVSTGAAFGASIAIYLNIFASENLPVTIFAFAGAALTLLAVMSIARVGAYVSSANLVIAGIIISSILGAAVTMIKSLAGEQVSAIVTWLIGSLAAKSWEHVLYGVPLIVLSCLVCWYYASDLNILSLGDDEARNLGIDGSKLRNVLLAAGALITAVCVSISGIIGFVGLIVPHMMRMFCGSDNRALVPLGALAGGLLLLVADTFGRSAMNAEIPVGVLTTLLGGPFFVYIFRKRNKTIH